MRPRTAAFPTVTVKPDVDQEAWDQDCLTTRQRSFVEAMMGLAAGNATKAAELAGYAAENRNALAVTASRLLNNAKVQAALARAFAERNDDPEWARARLLDIASATMANFLETGEDGEEVLSLSKARGAAALGHIREFKEELLKTSDVTSIIKRTVKLHDPLPALVAILKLQGKLKEAVEHTGKVNHEHSVSTRDAMARLRSDPDAMAKAMDLADRIGDAGDDTTSRN